MSKEKPNRLAMVNLDADSTYTELDVSGMIAHLRAFPEQCRLAWQKVSNFDLPEHYKEIDKVVVLGMGGSAIGGYIASGLALAESKVPIWIHRDYSLPPFVDKHTLVIASSYSGSTEETLSAFSESLKTGAKRLTITTGGKLAEIAQKEGIPLYRIDYQSPPRAAFPHSFIPLFGILQKTGVISDKSDDFTKMEIALKQTAKNSAETVPLESNPAKQLANELVGHINVIYGAEMLSPVAQRWKTQFNENSKTWAFHEAFPELNHNAIVGYLYPSQARQIMFVVLLHSTLLHPRVQLRYQATMKLLNEARIGYELVKAQGEGILAQVLNLVLFGDYVSFYLALLNKTDPTPVKVIDNLKSYLARFPFQS